MRDTESSFAINGDTIFYYHSDGAYRYLLTNDEIKIENGDNDTWEIGMSGKDTLVMIGTEKNKGMQDSLRRFNN